VYYPHPEELREGPDGRGTNVHHGLAPTCFNKTRAPVDSCWRNIVLFFFFHESIGYKSDNQPFLI